MRCARDCQPTDRPTAGPKVDFETQPVFDDEGRRLRLLRRGVEAHPKIIGMTDSEGKEKEREGGRLIAPQSFLPLTGQSAPLF